MLLAIRERVMGLVGWILLGILAIAFSFFGLDWYMRSDSRVYAASVNDVDIPLVNSSAPTSCCVPSCRSGSARPTTRH